MNENFTSGNLLNRQTVFHACTNLLFSKQLLPPLAPREKVLAVSGSTKKILACDIQATKLKIDLLLLS